MGKIIEADFQGSIGLEGLICESLKIARHRRGFTEGQLARRVRRNGRRDTGLTAASIRAYESGALLPDVLTYLRIMSAGGLDVEGRLRTWVAGGMPASPSW